MKQVITLILATFLAIALPSYAAETPERSEVPDKYKWDLESMYASTADWEKDVARLDAMLPDIQGFRGKLGKNARTLREAIETLEDAKLLLERVYIYAGYAYFQDLRDSEAAARFSKAQGISAGLNEATAFFRPELLAIEPRRLERLIESDEALTARRHFFDEELRMRDYTLGEAEERILAAANDPLGKFNSVYAAFNNADIKFGDIKDEQGNTVELTKARYGKFLFAENRQVREDAWMGLFTEYENMGNFLAAIYEGHVKGRVFQARVRGFDSAMEASTYTNGVPSEVYTTLIETLRDNTAPLQRYMELRRQALGYDTLHIWDTYAPVTEPSFEGLNFDDALQVVADSLEPLGPEYLDVYWKGVREGWIDAMETKGKRGGAYSWGAYGEKPLFSMNYTGDFNSLGTIAHEYGHSIHRYLRNQAQPYVYSGARIFIAEVASMTSEAVMLQNLLADTDDPRERLFLLQQYLDSFRSSMFRQASFADFELQAHQAVESGEALTKNSLNKLYGDVFETYYGDSVAVPDLNNSEWSRIPHFMRNDNFYVYQYATSFIAAQALAKRILEEGEPARERFLDLLKAGDSDYPVALLQKAGVDMTTPGPVEDALALMDRLLDEFEAAMDSSTAATQLSQAGTTADSTDS